MATAVESLASLPQFALSEIVRYLELIDVIKLVKLSGNATLWKSCVVGEGVVNLAMDGHEPSLKYLRQFPRGVPPFQSLVSLTIRQGSISNDRMPNIAPWMAFLPRTMRELRLGFFNSLASFLRPVDPFKDDMDTLYKYSFNGQTSLNLQSMFPHLVLLHLETPGWPESHLPSSFPASLAERFIRNLPGSLTSLVIPVTFVRVPLPTALVFSMGTLSNLTHFGLSSPSSHKVPFRSLMPAHKATFNDSTYRRLLEDQNEVRIREHIGPQLQLESLGPISPSLDASLGLLAHMTNLVNLDLEFGTRIRPDDAFQLPHSLRSLRLVHYQSVGSHFLSILLSVPHLTKCHMLYHEPGPTAVFDYLPPNIADLRLTAPSDQGISVACALPMSLERLHLIGTLMTPFQQLYLLKLSRLEHLGLRSDVFFDKSKNSFPSSLPVPASLKSLSLTGYQDISILKVLPKTLTALSCDLVIETAQDFEGLEVWSQDTVMDALRRSYVPHISSQNFKYDVLQKDWLDTPKFKQYRPGTRSAFERPAFHPGLTHYHSHKSLPDLLFAELPDGLIEFRAGRAHFNMPRCKRGIFSNPSVSGFALVSRGSPIHIQSSQILSSTTYQLPPSLREYGVIDPQMVHDDDLPGSPLVLWPLLQTAPLLETLTLQSVQHIHMSALIYLPNTLTSLTLFFSWGESVSIELNQLVLDHTWLPQLAHLSLTDVRVSIASLLPFRLQRLRSLRLDTLYVDSESFPPVAHFVPAQGDLYINDTFLAGIVRFNMIPPHLRVNIETIDIQWNAETFSKLEVADRVKSVHVLHSVPDPSLQYQYTQQTASLLFSNSFEDLPTKGASLRGVLPLSLTALDISKIELEHLSGPTFLPHSITKLTISLVQAATVPELPPQLHELNLWTSSGLIHEEFVGALPRSLRIFRVNNSLKRAAYPCLPALIALSIPSQPPAGYVLPRSLTYLWINNQPITIDFPKV